MKTKTKKVIGWTAFGFICLVVLIALAIPNISCGPTPSEDMAAVASLRQTAIVIFTYANDLGDYPNELSDLPEGWLEDTGKLQKYTPVIHYSKPPHFPPPSDSKFIMLRAPTDNGEAIAYSNTSTEFIRKKE